MPSATAFMLARQEPNDNLAQLLGAHEGRKNRLASAELLGRLEGSQPRNESELLQDPNFIQLQKVNPEQAESFQNQRAAIRNSLKVEDEESEKAFFKDMRNVKLRLEGGDLEGAMKVLLNRRVALNKINGAETDDVDRIFNRIQSGDIEGALTDLTMADDIAVQNEILPSLSREDEFKDRELSLEETVASNDSASKNRELDLKERGLDLEEVKLANKESQDPKISTAQRGAATFAKRTLDSGNVITELGENFTGSLSRLSGIVPQGLKGENRQKFDQATRDFINATLRRESGAAIAPSEFESAELQYIPQPGDSDAVLEQKQKNRETISSSLRLEAGQAFDDLESLDNPKTFDPVPAGSDDEEGDQAVDANGMVIIVKNGQWVAK